ncbi:MAG: tellurium resistance protein TerA, partial [Pseudomonadales bacterium]
VDLTKRAGQLGTIKANLNWIPSTGGFFASKIDLDLGAYIELNNGQRTIVQALDQIFEYGDYIKLLGDDRSGDSIDGEWMHINGDRLDEVKRIIIYAFIYQGTPNWEKAKAKVTLHVPDMPPIETHLTEEDKNSTFCAIAELKVASGAVQVERLNRFFNGHMECDQAYGWGFSWQKGSK